MSMGLSSRSSAGKRPGPCPFGTLLVGKRPFYARAGRHHLWGNRPGLVRANDPVHWLHPCPREALHVGNRLFVHPCEAPTYLWGNRPGLVRANDPVHALARLYLSAIGLFYAQAGRHLSMGRSARSSADKRAGPCPRDALYLPAIGLFYARAIRRPPF